MMAGCRTSAAVKSSHPRFRSFRSLYPLPDCLTALSHFSGRRLAANGKSRRIAATAPISRGPGCLATPSFGWLSSERPADRDDDAVLVEVGGVDVVRVPAGAELGAEEGVGRPDIVAGVLAH